MLVMLAATRMVPATLSNFLTVLSLLTLFIIRLISEMNVINVEALTRALVRKVMECVAHVSYRFGLFMPIKSGLFITCIITVTARCGDVSSENNTYFESDGDEKGHCTVKICKAKASIVQLRLDFETFNILGPSSTVTVQTVSNNVAPAAGTPSNLATACLDDSFSVSNPGGQSPPVICGNNNDMHSKFYLLDKL